MWNVVSLDGYFEGAEPWDLGFHQTVWGKELQDYSNEQLASADMLVFGENTYKGMADYWTKAQSETEEDAETIRGMNSIRKIVCSPTMKSAEWNNTTVVSDATVEIPKLKQEGNGNMFVFGSGILSASLMGANLFDEYRLCIAPVILGNGRRLFEEGLPYEELKLIENRALSNGGVVVRYAPKK